MLMTVTKHLFRAASSQEILPERIVTNMNTYMSEENDNAMFVTLFVGVLDLTTGNLCYCNAGHEAPLFLRQEPNEIPVEANFPVGLMPGLSYLGQRLLMEPGAMLFFYTDGLTEAEDNLKNQFGKERLRTVIQELMTEGDVSPQKVVEKIEEAVKTFVGDAEQNDDLTMLALKYIGLF
jgi:sigma-B regulation protein RsbU (phosphoserine phosphatase)